jgi:hypothetical protein
VVRHVRQGRSVLEGGPRPGSVDSVQAPVEAVLAGDVPLVAGGSPEALLELGPEAVAAETRFIFQNLGEYKIRDSSCGWGSLLELGFGGSGCRSVEARGFRQNMIGNQRKPKQ